MIHQEDTIIAVSTPAGVGAIANIRLSGPEAISIVDSNFKSIHKNKTLLKQKSHTESELDDSTFGVFLNLLKFIDNQVIFSCIDDHFSSKMDSDYKDFKKFHVEQLR